MRVFRATDPRSVSFGFLPNDLLAFTRFSDPRSVSFGFLPNDLLAFARFSIHGTATRQFRTARAGRSRPPTPSPRRTGNHPTGTDGDSSVCTQSHPTSLAALRVLRRLVVPEITPPEQMEIQACVHSRTQPHSPRSESSAASSYRKSPHPETHSNSGLCTVMHKRNKICRCNHQNRNTF